MRTLSTFDLDARGIAWIRARLADLSVCGDQLAGFCAPLDKLVVAGIGRTWTLAPTGELTDQLYRFESGGLLPENRDMSRAVDLGGSAMMPIEGLHTEEREILLWLLQEQVGRACIMVDPDLTRDHPSLSDLYRSTAFYVGDRVFHIVDASSDDEVFDRAFDACPFWCNLRVVTSAPPKGGLGCDAGLEELVQSATATIALSCSAYDGEGFVVWQRNR